MNRKEFIDFVSKRSEIPRYRLEESLDAFTDGVRGAFEQGKNVKLVGFGTFGVKESSPRTGRNMISGETIIIPTHYRPYFKPGAELVEAVRQYEREQKGGCLECEE